MMDRLFDNLKHVISANVVTGLANVLSAVWFARSLGPTVMGDYAMIVVAVQLLTAVLSPGLNQALIRDPSNRNLAAAATVGTFMQSFLIVGAAGVLYECAVISDPKDLFLPAVGLTAATVISLWVYLLSVPFEADLRYGSLVEVRLIALFVSTVAGILAAQAGYGVNALVVRDLLSSTLSLGLIRYRSPMILTWRPWQAGLPDLIRFIRGLWPLNVVERLVLRLDYAVIAWLFDLETLGTYFAVRGIVEGGLGFLLSPIQTVLYAHYCRLPDVKTVVQTLFRKDHLILMGLLIGGAMVMLQTIGKPIVAFTLGPEYGGGSALLGGLTLYAVSVVWFEHMKVLAMSRGSHHPMTIARMSQLAVSVVLIYPFVQLFGLAGAGLSAGIAATVMAILSTWIFNRTFLAEPLQVNPSAQVLRS